MGHRIYNADEARALLADYTATPRITFGDECLGGVPLCVDGRELCMVAPEDPEGDWLYVDRWEAAMHNAAPGLAETVVQLAARADVAEQERAALRARVAELTAALRFCARECARCSRPGVWLSFNGIVWCDEHKDCGAAHHCEPQPIEHADVLRSLGAKDSAT